VVTVARDRLDPSHLAGVVEAFAELEPVECGDDVSASTYVGLCEAVPALAKITTSLFGDSPSSAQTACAVELALEYLHLSKRLNKDAVGGRSQYRARG
jgi:magnesium chelatase subunit I